MKTAVTHARLYLLGGAALVFLGGLLLALNRWNQAEIDRAFVAAAARAAAAPPTARPAAMRIWVPAASATPSARTTQIQIEAADRLRAVPSLPASPATRPSATPPPAGKPAPAAP
ncbi:hypothetical protein GXW74_12890 [Roseomonas eburnea]|uniref:Uncharacterized protein n=1 Tax=Neoroseomonas eburnea TaxID=1346889 RepID=A0A9X9XCE9_9PROT|nr:hypothetical protein [Neoroseomonas eburnea]MBR0681385.1 hypothetical protein [Neoroseomonas eburnea]